MKASWSRSLGVMALTVALVAVLLGSGVSVARAAFPDGTITIIAPAAAGGGTDLTARNLARNVEPILDVSVVVKNIPGGGNAIGITAGYTADPDGYTLVLGQVETVLLPLMGRVAWEAEDFTPIIGVDKASAALTVRADSPWKTVEDFVDYAKAHPGDVRVGGSTPGTVWHLAAAGLEQAIQTPLNVIPYPGGAAPAIKDLLGGTLDAVTVSGGEVSDQVKAGNLRVLAIMRSERAPEFPDVPTFNELGYDLEVATWWSLFAPPDTPDSVAQTLRRAFTKAWHTSAFQTFVKKQRLEPMYIPADDFPEFIEHEQKTFKPILKQLGLSE